MRIKIEGEITAERLAEALERLLEKLDDIPNKTFSVIGANIYFNVFDETGTQIEIKTKEPRGPLITMAAPRQGIIRPALTAEAVIARELREAERAAEAVAIAAKIKAHKELQKSIRDKEIAYDRAVRARWSDWHDRLMVHHDAAKALLETLNARSAFLITFQPDYVDQLNAIVDDVWQELSPINLNNPNKGKPQLKPVYMLVFNRLTVGSPEAKTSRTLKNPVATTVNSSKIQGDVTPPFLWRNPAWEEASRRIYAMIARLTDHDFGALSVMMEPRLVGEPDDIPLEDYLPKENTTAAPEEY